jgi:hypothetical protein
MQRAWFRTINFAAGVIFHLEEMVYEAAAGVSRLGFSPPILFRRLNGWHFAKDLEELFPIAALAARFQILQLFRRAELPLDCIGNPFGHTCFLLQS